MEEHEGDPESGGPAEGEQRHGGPHEDTKDPTTSCRVEQARQGPTIRQDGPTTREVRTHGA